MRKMNWMLPLLIVGVVWAGIRLSGCERSSDIPSTTTTSSTTTSSSTTTTRLPIKDYKNDLEVSVFTDKSSYSLSEDVTFTLKVRNKTSAVINTYFPTTQLYDLYVHKSGVYTWSRYYNQAFLAIPIPFTLGPGSTEVIVDYVWEQKDNSGSAVGTGSYSVTGYLGDPLYDMPSTETFLIL